MSNVGGPSDSGPFRRKACDAVNMDMIMSLLVAPVLREWKLA